MATYWPEGSLNVPEFLESAYGNGVLYRIALGHGRDDAVARDAVSALSIQLGLAIKRGRAPESADPVVFMRYVTRCIHRKVATILGERTRKDAAGRDLCRRLFYEPGNSRRCEDPLQNLMIDERVRLVRETLDMIPKKDAFILRNCLLRGRSHAQVARRLKMDATTLSNYLYRDAMSAFRGAFLVLLEKRCGDTSDGQNRHSDRG